LRISLIPREEQFFDLIERSAQYLVEGAKILHELCGNFTDLDAKIEQLNGIEHACDEVTHATLDKLETTFITPLDREDIHHLMLRMDDVIDMTTAAASRMKMFRARAPRKGIEELGAIIVRQTEALLSALCKLRNPKKYSLVGNDCIEVHRLENQADDIVKKIIGDLFENETNAIELLRWKEIFETLETITDCGEDVANVIQGIVVKQA
jgi:predicted phosphate transport protein (TIGR00153 family)